MLRLSHYNDGKEKSQSHEVTISDVNRSYNAEHDIFSLNPFDITGYGATQEEALENFKEKIDYVLREWRAFEKMLFETDVVSNSITDSRK